TQIEQVIMNLVINARDAMPEGGAITIETGAALLTEAEKADQGVPSKHVLLSVKDNGCGMSVETKAHIFEPFFTTKEQGKGTGLGLATVFGVIRQSAGHITVESQPGQGTIFKIFLPQTDEPLPPDRPQEITEVVRGRETVLLVEDESSV